MLTAAEILSALDLGLIYGFLALGLFFTFRVINLTDMSLPASFVTGCAIGVMGVNTHGFYGLFWSFFVNGLLSLGLFLLTLKTPSLMASIIWGSMLFSINLRIMGQRPNILLENFINLDLSYLLFLSLIICLICGHFLYSKLGLVCRSFGSNAYFFKLMGFSSNLVLMVSLFISHGLIGFSGALFSVYQGFADINSGNSGMVSALASLAIAKKIYNKNNLRLAVLAIFVGSIVYRFVIMLAFNLLSYLECIRSYSSDLNLIAGFILFICMQKFIKEK